jgi:polyphosphate kinase 2
MKNDLHVLHALLVDLKSGAGMKRKKYEEALEPLHVELENLARWLRHSGSRMVVILEGRDTSGKGGVIHAIAERLNPRRCVVAQQTLGGTDAVVAQRYIGTCRRRAAGALDRSWYNRAGVEKVMGFCTKDEYRQFLEQAPVFEKTLVDSGILLFKYWLSVDQVEQEERFAERAADPLKRWKLSPIDLKAREHYQEYGEARDEMFRATHTKHAPWVVVDFGDQRRGRLNLIRHLLDQVPDTRIPEKPLNLPPLEGKPAKEKFKGPVSPIKGWY